MAEASAAEDRLPEETIQRLRTRLGDGPRLAFAVAVLDQARRAGGWGAAPGPALVLRVVELLEGAGRGSGDPGLLAGDPPLLAAFFQNVDLLYAAAHPDADAVGTLVMEALERAGAGEPAPLRGRPPPEG